jgi:hypothetical protein
VCTTCTCNKAAWYEIYYILANLAKLDCPEEGRGEVGEGPDAGNARVNADAGSARHANPHADSTLGRTARVPGALLPAAPRPHTASLACFPSGLDEACRRLFCAGQWRAASGRGRYQYPLRSRRESRNVRYRPFPRFCAALPAVAQACSDATVSVAELRSAQCRSGTL